LTIKKFIKEEIFHHYFQPIYYLESGDKLGFEALLRSTVYPNPESVFQEAKKENWLYKLDSRSIHQALLTYQSAGLSKMDGNLFINILPSTILNQRFLSFLKKIVTENYLDIGKIVLEISGSEIIEEFDTFVNRLSEIIKQGFLIAIDDIGDGYSHFKTIIELEPDYLKLVRYLSEELHLSKQKQTFISFHLSYAKQYKCPLILEGIETEMEMETAKELGVTIARGYFLGRPALL